MTPVTPMTSMAPMSSMTPLGSSRGWLGRGHQERVPPMTPMTPMPRMASMTSMTHLSRLGGCWCWGEIERALLASPLVAAAAAAVLRVVVEVSALVFASESEAATYASRTGRVSDARLLSSRAQRWSSAAAIRRFVGRSVGGAVWSAARCGRRRGVVAPPRGARRPTVSSECVRDELLMRHTSVLTLVPRGARRP